MPIYCIYVLLMNGDMKIEKRLDAYLLSGVNAGGIDYGKKKETILEFSAFCGVGYWTVDWYTG